MRTLIFTSALLFLFSGFAVSSENDLPKQKDFRSPDGRFSVNLVENDRQKYFSITDEKTGAVDSSVKMPTVLLFLEWAANSKAFVAVEHIARGSYAQIFFFHGKWHAQSFEPPGSSMIYSVVQVGLNSDQITLKYGVTKQNDVGYPVSYFVYTVSANMNDGRKLAEKWLEISQDELIELLDQRPKSLR